MSRAKVMIFKIQVGGGGNNSNVPNPNMDL